MSEEEKPKSGPAWWQRLTQPAARKSGAPQKPEQKQEKTPSNSPNRGWAQAAENSASSLTQPARAATLPRHLQCGLQAEALAAQLLQQQGLQIVARNYKTPGRGGGEIDIIAREGTTLVFVEVRQRKNAAFGGAAASISASKQARWRYAAQKYLQRFGNHPPDCRFDVMLLQGQQPLEWLKGVM